MAKVGDITVNLNLDEKNKLRLRAIAKHFGALADELDRIDDMKECPACGSYKATTATLTDDETWEAISVFKKCDDCGNELPTRLEGSQ